MAYAHQALGQSTKIPRYRLDYVEVNWGNRNLRTGPQDKRHTSFDYFITIPTNPYRLNIKTVTQEG